MNFESRKLNSRPETRCISLSLAVQLSLGKYLKNGTKAQKYTTPKAWLKKRVSKSLVYISSSALSQPREVKLAEDFLHYFPVPHEFFRIAEILGSGHAFLQGDGEGFEDGHRCLYYRVSNWEDGFQCAHCALSSICAHCQDYRNVSLLFWLVIVLFSTQVSHVFNMINKQVIAGPVLIPKE